MGDTRTSSGCGQGTIAFFLYRFRFIIVIYIFIIMVMMLLYLLLSLLFLLFVCCGILLNMGDGRQCDGCTKITEKWARFCLHGTQHRRVLCIRDVKTFVYTFSNGICRTAVAVSLCTCVTLVASLKGGVARV